MTDFGQIGARTQDEVPGTPQGAHRAAATAYHPHITVTYRGKLIHDVWATFARYDAFVFPTRGENFGHVIAKTLAAFVR